MQNVDWNDIRLRFPVCKRITYLNAAGGSPMSVDASVEGKRYFDEMLLYGDSCWEEWLARTEETRIILADFVGAKPEEMGFAPNTSSAMAMIALLLKEQGSVLVMDDEFPSSTVPWLNAGVDMEFVVPENGIYSIKHIEKQLHRNHKILISSYVQYKTGFRQNLTELGAFCHSNNLIYIVNATQGMGIFPIDVDEDRIDCMVFSGLKWACSGYGGAGLYVRKSLLDKMTLPVAGWRSTQLPEAMNNRLLDVRRETSSLEAGSPSFPAIFALGGALKLISRIGQDNCLKRVLFLSELLEQQLKSNGFPVVYTFEKNNKSGIVMVKTSNASEITKKLALQNIIVSSRGIGLRISVNFYNNKEDIEVLISALKNIRNLFG